MGVETNVCLPSVDSAHHRNLIGDGMAVGTLKVFEVFKYVLPNERCKIL